MTEKQYSFAWNIANTLGIPLPENYSNKAFSVFIDENLSAFKNKQQEIQQKRQNEYEFAQFQSIIKSQSLYEQGLEI